MSVDIQKKEEKLNRLKKVLEEFIKQSTSAEDDSPFVLDAKEEAQVKDLWDKIQKMEARIAELKEKGADSEKASSDIKAVIDKMKQKINELGERISQLRDKLNK
ncbi:MAG: hypothetical protein MK207_14995 [Saprospiraceae bacterium]|nr:hypothetical protein [Saprospiraceae bacterium]